jgi:hypothetical protein
MASERLDKIVNDCLKRMASGEPVEACLASYPEDRGQLAPLLKTAAKTLMAATTVGPDAMARQGGLQKFNEAVAQRATGKRERASHGSSGNPLSRDQSPPERLCCSSQLEWRSGLTWLLQIASPGIPFAGLRPVKRTS